MPIMDLLPLDFEEPHIRFTPIKVLAYMLFPSDDEARNDFLKGSLLDAGATLAKAYGVSLSIDQSAVDVLTSRKNPLAMIEAATKYVIRGAAKAPGTPRRIAGTLAGESLLMAIANVQNEPGSVSLNWVLDRASSNYRGAQRTRPSDLKTVWHEYRAAAHLWAAALYWNIVTETPDGKAALGVSGVLVPHGREPLKAFLALAETLRIKGEGIKHKNAKDAFLPAGITWRLPDSLSYLRLPELGS
jgi:hypothetical protein